ncbi:MAG: hypothetical protein EHM22_05040, partial [Actinobacteria bacterium]
MAILALGISHRRAEVGLLERLAFAEDDLVKAYRRTADDPAIDEAVIVSTCNRVEIYGSVPSYHAGFQALKRVLCESRGVAPTIWPSRSTRTTRPTPRNTCSPSRAGSIRWCSASPRSSR